MFIHIDLGYHPVLSSGLSLKVKVQIGIFDCTDIMGQDLVHPYIQSTTILCDNNNNNNNNNNNIIIIITIAIMAILFQFLVCYNVYM